MSRSQRRKNRGVISKANGLRVADMCGQDTGGQSYKLSQAVTRFTKHVSRSFRKSDDYLEFPADICFGEHDQDMVREYLASVDVVHVHGMYRRASGWSNISSNARWLMHQHGRLGQHLADERSADRIRRAHRVVSTINLLSYVGGDESRWIPAPLDLDAFSLLKERFPPSDEELLVAHSPTRRAYKGTDLIAAVVDRLRSEGHPVRLVLIERQTHARCLRQRARCHVTYDQMHLCYGNSGLEGMAFGQPTIVGMPPETRSEVQRILGSEPYVFAYGADDLYEAMRRLVESPGMREEYGQAGLSYVRKWHDHRVVAARVARIYEALVAGDYGG